MEQFGAARGGKEAPWAQVEGLWGSWGPQWGRLGGSGRMGAWPGAELCCTSLMGAGAQGEEIRASEQANSG